MSTDYHQLYLDDTATLAKTMVIKSQASVELINEYVTLRYGSTAVDPNDLTSWKYYKNICGQYHATDKMMSVTSLDTLETIDFTVENLAIHTATATTYAYGSRYFYALLNTFPDQEQLILGVLYPASMATAIDAEDYTILAYPLDLVESQEITLMSELQEWLYRFKLRWDVQAFGVSDSLYPVAQHAILYLQLISKLLNLRVKRCKTNEAHSFHIRSYLASHCGLDRFFDYMTIKQALFLYRNIDYIEHNSGKTAIFSWLMDRLLTDRRIPLAGYQARLKGSFNAEYYPEYQFKKLPLNTAYNSPDKNYYDVSDLMAKEAKLVVGNPEFIKYQQAAIDNQFRNSPSSVLETKDLESSMLDYTNSQKVPLTTVLFDHWIWLSHKGYYHAAVSFKDPRTSEDQTIFSDDAVIYWLYIMSKGLGAPLLQVPTYQALRVQRLVPPTVDQLMAVVDTTLIPDTTLATWLLAHQPTLVNCHSVSAFLKLGVKIYEAELRHWYLTARTEHMYERAIVENMINQLYSDEPIVFAAARQPMADWLREKSLPDTDYSVTECLELMGNIFNAATGYSVDPTQVIGNIQNAMLSIMAQLSSYSIQFIQEINTNPIVLVPWAAIRVGTIYTTFNHEVLTDDGIFVIDTDGEVAASHRIESVPVLISENIDSSVAHERSIRSTVTCSVHHELQQGIPITLPRFNVNVRYAEYDPMVSDPSGFIGYEVYQGLTIEQQDRIGDIYGSPTFKRAEPTAVMPIEDVIIYDTLHALTYISLSSKTLEI